MKKKEVAFTLLRVTGNELTNPQNRVTQFLNSSEAGAVLDISFNHNPQLGDLCEVTILYEKEVAESENNGGAEWAKTTPSQTFKRRPKPGPLR